MKNDRRWKAQRKFDRGVLELLRIIKKELEYSERKKSKEFLFINPRLGMELNDLSELMGYLSGQGF